MPRVAVSGPVLDWALQRSGKPSVIKRRFPKFVAWLEGESQPTLRELEDLAKATSTPLGYFFLPKPPEERLPIPHFRTLSDEPTFRPSADLLDTIELMERRQAWMRENLIEQGREPLAFVGSASAVQQPGLVAGLMRARLGLEGGWAAEQATWRDALRMLEKRLEDIGILVAVNSVVGNNTHRKLSVSEFRGFVLADNYAPLVFVNGSDGRAAQMFTLSHELAHVWFGSSAAFDLRELQPAADETEKACNRVAAEFLIPEAEIRQLWSLICDESQRFQLVARRFKVSGLVGARRALDLGLVTKNEFLDFYQAYLDDERRTVQQVRDGGNFYQTQNLRIGRRFGENVVHAAREGRLLYNQAYRLTGLYGNTFERYAEMLGFPRRPQ
ncbi:MAG: ImmA/IrrE family metallo-endopeptidase [Thermoleophilia bacterium]